VLVPARTDEVTTGALARVLGELAAAGFDVRELPQDPGSDIRTRLETAGRELDPIATFAIVRGPATEDGGGAADIWVCDRLAETSVIKSVHLAGSANDPERAAAVIAVQAVELLKASLAQYWIGPTRPPPGPGGPPPIAEPVAPAATEGPYVSRGLTAEAAVGLLDSVGAVGPAWEPVLRVAYGSDGGWAARASVSGLGSDTALHAPTGSAELEQAVGTIEVVRSFRAGRVAQLFASAGGGVYHLRVAGAGMDPWQGTVTSLWAGLAIAGLGVALPLGAHLALLGEGQALVTVPSTVVRIAGAEVGRTGLPGVLASAGLLGRF
jgi:hypothetical protein